MQEYIKQRCQDIGLYIAETHCTVRQAAKHFNISKSSVHKDTSYNLPHINRTLYDQVRQVLDKNKAERHIRGGLATQQKYKHG